MVLDWVVGDGEHFLVVFEGALCLGDDAVYVLQGWGDLDHEFFGYYAVEREQEGTKKKCRDNQAKGEEQTHSRVSRGFAIDDF